MLNFGEAIEALKAGHLVQRVGWNGKGMFIFMRPADELTVEFIVNKVKSLPESLKTFYKGQFAWNSTESEAGNGPDKATVKFGSYLCMKAADGSIVNGWLASQTDILSEDWQLLTVSSS